MCEILIELGKDILIGLISGALSSWAVTALWQKKIDAKEKEHQNEVAKREYESSYYDTVQVLCRYLERLQLELDFKNDSEKSNNIRRLLDAYPSTSIFNKALTNEGKNEILKLNDLKNNLDKDAESGLLSDEKSKIYKREIFQFELQFLIKRFQYLKPFEEMPKN